MCCNRYMSQKSHVFLVLELTEDLTPFSNMSQKSYVSLVLELVSRAYSISYHVPKGPCLFSSRSGLKGLLSHYLPGDREVRVHIGPPLN